jgi:hypothetical protein
MFKTLSLNTAAQIIFPSPADTEGCECKTSGVPEGVGHRVYGIELRVWAFGN